ncbi:MAG TPA: hydroxymethylglutaryl-CoA lyase [Proteobacteria bacterium]|nr:hydroxymethylglutaryl-CoA lyase [Pseudomonadota bacterium]
MDDCFSLMPKKVRLVEVSPRDGWQNQEIFIPTENKVELINRLAACGFKEIEVTSFVNPKSIPQLRDAAEVLQAIDSFPDLVTSVLVPNRRGLTAALASGAGKIVFFISASDTHNKKNLGCSQAETLAEIEAMIKMMPLDRARRVSLSNVFGCPYEGKVDYAAVSSLVGSLFALGFNEITLCDTLGVATPDQVYSHCSRLQEELPEVDFGLHLHDSCGRALACVVAGLQAGIDRYDSAASGLGGCPYAPGAAGNLATEDLLYCLEGMRIETGIDSHALLEVAIRQTQLTYGGHSHMQSFIGACVKR